MAIMLMDVQANVQDHLSAQVIDEFRKNNYLLDNMVFDDAVSPTGGGATLTPEAEKLLADYENFEREVRESADALFEKYFSQYE